MSRRRFFYCSFMAGAVALLALVIVGPAPILPAHPDASSLPASYIVQATTVEKAIEAVEQVGGEVSEELRIIRAVGAQLTPRQVTALKVRGDGIKVYEDKGVQISGAVPETHFPTLINAAELHQAGIDGRGITIAVLDTGLWKKSGIELNASQEKRILAQYDVLMNSHNAGDDDDDDDDDEPDYEQDIDDWNGHGTHITSVMMGSDRTPGGTFTGVAPGANVVAVKAFEPNGSGRYIDVIKGIGWIVAHRREYGIRILNLSFSGEVTSHYWDDPLNQAVMAAWASGIVVVAAAGNGGPDPMTIGVPGNVPYVVTVGAMTDNYTPGDATDDYLATFSSAGPTYEGFVKPEIVAPGGHLLGLMPPHGWLALQYPQFMEPDIEYFTMSGTSQSTAVVSGVVALMLQAEPRLRPNDVKCRLMASARPAVRDDGTPAYSVFQQGAGLVNAIDAINSGASGCANAGMSVILDLFGWWHYGGLANEDENGQYYLMDLEGDSPDGKLIGDGYTWSRGDLWSRGALWGRGVLWSRGNVWSRGVLWSQSYLWSQGDLETDNILWSPGLTEPVAINRWVEQE